MAVRRSVKERAGCRDLEAEMGRIRIPPGMQLDVNVDCGCERVDIVDVDVKVFYFLSTSCVSGPAVAERRVHCVAARSRRRRAHLSLLNLCSAVGAGSAERQR